MSDSSRDAFLKRVQQALKESNRPGDAAELPERGRVGYQGAGADPLTRFRDELTAAGGNAYLVADREAAIRQVIDLVQGHSARKALLGTGSFVDGLNLGEPLRAAGVEVILPGSQTPENCREPFFAADIGITGVDYLIAETGTVALLARRGEPRSFSLLPPVHIAVAQHTQVLADLFDLFEQFALLSGKTSVQGRPKLPSCLSLITGPSKTGDIELRLVTGVHGPGEIHVVVVTGKAASG
jgi:L-lactate dehydrogenase complex protein LldG